MKMKAETEKALAAMGLYFQVTLAEQTIFTSGRFPINSKTGEEE